jgi:pilus assembly protein Flp/PilA
MLQASGALGDLLIMLTTFRQFVVDEYGATAIEYGLIAALVSVAAILALTALGSELSAIFNATRTAMASAD